MMWIALRMLTGDRSKYIAIIFGVTFACFLIAEQTSIFCGVMLRTTSQIYDTQGADIWVMNSNLRYIDDAKAISDDDVFRVRSVPGVLWAVNFYRGQGQAQLANGNYQNLVLMGLDDSSLVGAPKHLLVGKLGDLQDPDAILVDEAGFHQMWPGEPLYTGKVHRDERSPRCNCGRIPRLADIHDHADHLHPIQPGDAVRSAVAAADALRIGQVRTRCFPHRGCPPHRGADRTQGADQEGIYLAHHEVLSPAHRHSRQFRHHGDPRFPGRLCHRGADVLPVYRREPQTIRHAESDGNERSGAWWA